MKKRIIFGLSFLALVAIISSCSSGDELDNKRKQLEKLKEQLTDLKLEIKNLETELESLDPSYADSKNRTVTVTSLDVKSGPFIHRIEVRGNVASRKNVNLTAEAMGTVIQVNVNPGDEVKNGQTLVKLDAEVMQNTIRELKTALDLASTIFEKQSALWKQGVGSEIQYLEAKNRKETLESQLATANSRLRNMDIKAPFNGLVNAVPAKIGEMAQPGMTLISMLSNEEMYIEAEVSERYIGRFNKGDEVEIFLPSINTTLSSTITAIGYVINPANRTFTVEIKLPAISGDLKPNQLTVLKMRDYEQEDAISIPTNLIQQDAKGDYVYLIISKEDKLIAQKQYIKRGLTYAMKTEVLEGLKGDERIVERGAREVVDGIQLQFESKRRVASNN
jgi:membrane fusion protein, multidrug efflux system